MSDPSDLVLGGFPHGCSNERAFTDGDAPAWLRPERSTPSRACVIIPITRSFSVDTGRRQKSHHSMWLYTLIHDQLIQIALLADETD